MRYLLLLVDNVVTECFIAPPVGDEVTFVERLNSEFTSFDVVELDGPLTIGVGSTLMDDKSYRPPSPFASWTWNGSDWVSPVPRPDDGWWSNWDEDTQQWIRDTKFRPNYSYAYFDPIDEEWKVPPTEPPSPSHVWNADLLQWDAS